MLGQSRDLMSVACLLNKEKHHCLSRPVIVVVFLWIKYTYLMFCCREQTRYSQPGNVAQNGNIPASL